MKLSEIKLFEEPIPVSTAEQVWAENGDNANTYITKTVYLVKPVEGQKNQFEVYYDESGKRKLYGIMDGQALKDAFVPVRPDQAADAEGYTTYRLADEYDAFKYLGDPIKITLTGDDGQQVKLNKGDYMLRQDDDKDFIYTVERAAYFDNGYVKKT